MGKVRRLLRLLVAVSLVLTSAALGTPMPTAAAQVCTTGDPFSATTIRESILVPAGVTCVVSGSVIRGGVTVEPDGILELVSAEIRGSVSATGSSGVVISNSVIRGRVLMSGQQDFVGAIVVRNSEVRGDIVVDSNESAVIELAATTVRGSVVVTNNAALVVGLFVWGNTIDVNLDCTGNNPDPSFIIAPNTVGGAKLGQCADL